MDKGEVARLIMSAKTSVNQWRGMDKVELAAMIEFWHKCLKDVPFDFAENALVDFLSTNKFPPTIADIKKPWLDHLEDKKEKSKRLREIYYNTIDHYPCYSDTREIQNEWMRITGNDIGKAEQFKAQLVEYVRGCEMQGIDPIPFEEYMKGVKQIE